MIRKHSTASRLALFVLAGSCFPADLIAAPCEEGTTKVAANDATACVWSILLPKASASDVRPSAIAAQIARLGKQAIEPALAILFGESEEPDVPYEVDSTARENRQRILFESLRLLPPNDLVVAITNRIDAKTNVEQKVLAIRILALAGTGDALEHVFAIAAGLDPIQWQGGYVGCQIEATIVEIVAQDTHSVRRLAAALLRADTSLAPMFVRALATTRVSSAALVMARCLGRNSELDLCILEELAKIGARDGLPFESGEMGQLRGLLDSHDMSIKRAAAVALAELGDDDSCSAIIAMLESKDQQTVALAARALKSLTGQAFGNDVKAWTDWREREANWYETEFPRLTSTFASNESESVFDSARELLAHRMYRHRAALALRGLLASSDPETTRKVCAVFGMLGSSRALPWLLEELDNPDDAVRNEAWSSLRLLTRLDLPLDVGAWRALIRP